MKINFTKAIVVTGCYLFILGFTVPKCNAQDPFLGEIRMFAGNFEPRGWAFCDGRLLPIAQNPSLFSILGTTYGGDGVTTFALPDLRGRVPLGFGQGPGLSNYGQGQAGGTEVTTLTQGNMPSHSHTATVTNVSASIMASSQAGTEQIPGTNGAATLAAGTTSGRPSLNFNSTAPDVQLATGARGTADVTVGDTGGNQPVSNIQPYLGTNFIIALQGIYPSRNSVP